MKERGVPITEDIIPALHQCDEFEEADVNYLQEQIGIPLDEMQREIIKGFRRQIWHVAAEAGFKAAREQR